MSYAEVAQQLHTILILLETTMNGLTLVIDFLIIIVAPFNYRINFSMDTFKKSRFNPESQLKLRIFCLNKDYNVIF